MRWYRDARAGRAAKPGAGEGSLRYVGGKHLFNKPPSPGAQGLAGARRAQAESGRFALPHHTTSHYHSSSGGSQGRGCPQRDEVHGVAGPKASMWHSVSQLCGSLKELARSKEILALPQDSLITNASPMIQESLVKGVFFCKRF